MPASRTVPPDLSDAVSSMHLHNDSCRQACAHCYEPPDRQCVTVLLIMQAEYVFRGVAYHVSASISDGCMLTVELEQLDDTSRWRGDFPAACAHAWTHVAPLPDILEQNL